MPTLERNSQVYNSYEVKSIQNTDQQREVDLLFSTKAVQIHELALISDTSRGSRETTVSQQTMLCSEMAVGSTTPAYVFREGKRMLQCGSLLCRIVVYKYNVAQRTHARYDRLHLRLCQAYYCKRKDVVSSSGD
jgi:hypothetical protein